MKKYYAVCDSFYDSGKIVSNLVDTIEAEEKPEDSYKQTKRCDIYVEWFDTYEKAMQHIEECRLA